MKHQFLRFINEKWFSLLPFVVLPLISLIPSLFGYSILRQGYLHTWGTGFQIVGIIAVIYGVNAKLKNFSNTELFEELKLFTTKKKSATMTGSISATGSVSGNFKVEKNLDSASTDEKIDYILEELAKNREARRDIKKFVKERTNKNAQKFAEKISTVYQDISSIKRDLKTGFVSNFKMELFGAFCLITGLLYKGFSICF